MATESNTPAAAAAPAAKVARPDEEAFKKDVARLEKEHAAAMEKYNAIKAKIGLALPDKTKESPAQKRRQELIAQAKEIRDKQAGGKKGRTAKLEQIKRLDEELRGRIADQKAARGKVPFKSVEELDQKIEQLERDVERGQMKLVDEKKALAEISALRKQRKNFSQFDNDQKAIDSLRAKIKEIKDSLEDPEAKALSDQYDKVQAELDAIKAEQDEAYKSLSALRKERDELRAKQEATYQALKKRKDEYYAQRKAAQAWERQQREKRREREQAERERIAKERRLERAQQVLAEASLPAYAEELRRANSLVHFFDPSHAEEKSPLLADKGLAAAAQRKVDASGFEGMRLVRKEDRDDEYLPAVKKGKKGKKGHVAEGPGPAANKFSCPPSVIEECAFIGVEPPMSAAEVPAVIEKVKAKIAHWKADQAAQTQRNIDKAKKDLERLEAEEDAAAATAASANSDANAASANASDSGSPTDGKGADAKKEADKAVDEAAEKVEKVSLESEAPKSVEATA